MYEEEDLIPLSALQHYAFCRRQCALIHIEQIWEENLYTLEGRLLHEKVHSGETEKRRDTHTAFGMPVRSLELGLSGKTDTVEKNEDGTIHIVEMKRGRAKIKGMDEIQLCAQAMCLEEMLDVEIQAGALFYGRTRRRQDVVFDNALRQETEDAAKRFHELVESGVTPKAMYMKKCDNCSMYDLCMPKTVEKARSINTYLADGIRE